MQPYYAMALIKNGKVICASSHCKGHCTIDADEGKSCVPVVIQPAAFFVLPDGSKVSTILMVRGSHGPRSVDAETVWQMLWG